MAKVYVASRQSCGCGVAFIMDHPGNTERVARLVSEWILAGYGIDRIEEVEVAQVVWVCPHRYQNQRLLTGFETVDPISRRMNS